MTRAERIRKLANAIKDYRGSTHPRSGEWLRAPKPSARERVIDWLRKLGKKNHEIAECLCRIDEFKTWDDMQKFLKEIE